MTNQQHSHNFVCCYTLFTVWKLGASGWGEDRHLNLIAPRFAGSACRSKLCDQGHQRAWGLWWLSSCNNLALLLYSTEYISVGVDSLTYIFLVEWIHKLSPLLLCRFQFMNGGDRLPEVVGHRQEGILKVSKIYFGM